MRDRLLGCEHEDGEDKFGGQEHLDEEPLCNGCSSDKVCPDCQWTWEQSRDNGGSCDSAEDLCNGEEYPANIWESADETHA